MRIPGRCLVALAVVALVVAGCGGRGESNSRATGSTASPATSSAQQPTSASARTGASARTTSAPPSARTTPTPSEHPPTITPGTSLPGEMISASQAAALQQSIDEGHQPWRVQPDMVAEAYVRNRFGWEDLDVAMADPHTAEVTNHPDGQRVTLQERQPVREGPTGVWVVVGGTYLG